MALSDGTNYQQHPYQENFQDVGLEDHYGSISLNNILNKPILQTFQTTFPKSFCGQPTYEGRMFT